MDLVKDEDHDVLMVIIKNLDKLNEVINIDNFVHGIIPSLVEISDNNNWRVRYQIEEIIPVLARIVNRKLFFWKYNAYLYQMVNRSCLYYKGKGMQNNEKIIWYFKERRFGK